MLTYVLPSTDLACKVALDSPRREILPILAYCSKTLISNPARGPAAWDNKRHQSSCALKLTSVTSLQPERNKFVFFNSYPYIVASWDIPQALQFL